MLFQFKLNRFFVTCFGYGQALVVVTVSARVAVLKRCSIWSSVHCLILHNYDIFLRPILRFPSTFHCNIRRSTVYFGPRTTCSKYNSFLALTVEIKTYSETIVHSTSRFVKFAFQDMPRILQSSDDASRLMRLTLGAQSSQPYSTISHNIT